MNHAFIADSDIFENFGFRLYSIILPVDNEAKRSANGIGRDHE